MAESFFQRWTRRKAEASEAAIHDKKNLPADERSSLAPGEASPSESAAPTLQDVNLLNADSDYSSFIAKGVDKNVRRAAMKKLFSDPHFNVMDGLDIYIDDYTKPMPLTAAMLGAIQHARTTLEPILAYEREPAAPIEAAVAEPGVATALPPATQPDQLDDAPNKPADPNESVNDQVLVSASNPDEHKPVVNGLIDESEQHVPPTSLS